MGLTVVDAGVLIGLLDQHDAHHDAAKDALDEARDRVDTIVLPASALAEALVHPSRAGSTAVNVVLTLINRLPIEIAPLDEPTAVVAARVRAQSASMRLHDALVVATAVVVAADVLVTTDRGWPHLSQFGLTVRLQLLAAA